MRVEFVQDMPWHPPTTKLYRADDDHYLAVLVVSVPDVAAILAEMGVVVPIAKSHVRPEVSVFHADESGTLIDADGNPLNGLTPYASTDPECDAVVRLDPAVSSHDEALAALGHILREQEPTDG